MKIPESEYNEFWKYIGDEWYIDCEEDLEPVDGFINISAPAQLCYQGRSSPSPGVKDLIPECHEDGNFYVVFRKWRKLQKTVTMVATCPRELNGKVREAIRKAGGKVQ
jgi:hypothetical protein